MRGGRLAAWILSAVWAVGCSSSMNGDKFEAKAAWATAAFPAPVITQPELRALLDGPARGDVLLVDTRTREEYAVSHLQGAINWPDYAAGDVPENLRLHVEEGKPAVFYCSIGYRSGEAAVLARSALDGDAPLLNLRGGIFQWANEGGALEGGARVHPYDDEWGRLLRPELRAPVLERGRQQGRFSDEK